MPRCIVCKESVVSGYVLCSHCAESLEPHSLPAELAFVLDRLAEEVVLNEAIPACSMCGREDCSSQVSGIVCRSAVMDWLVSKATGYLTEFSGGKRV